MAKAMTGAELKALCESRGLRLTTQRRATFEALRSAGKPITAYDLLPKLEKRLNKRLAPLTVYRALDFLVDEGFVHKLASSHSYSLCSHPHDEHESLHLVCTECGSGEELSLGDIDKALTAAAAERNFQPKRRVVELEGLCERCSGN